jgi:hypothetical protein
VPKISKIHKLLFLINICNTARRWWLTPVILAIQEAEIRRIMVQRY